MTLLEVNGISKVYKARRRVNAYQLFAVRDMSFTVEKGVCVGLVGESGCGKSTLARLITGLESPSAGEIRLEGKPVHGRQGWASEGAAFHQKVQMIFQDSLDAVNPRHSALTIIAEPLVNFSPMSKREIAKRVEELLSQVGLRPSDAEKFPHEFSGGQLQRICIARALASNPELLVLDEPLSSLDVSVQAQILNLLQDLKDRLHLTYILISHDPEAVYYLSDTVVVMYGGRVMERIDRIEDFDRMRHPYTRRLLSSTSLYRNWQEAGTLETEAIAIDMEVQKEGYEGCPYAGRCGKVDERCKSACPPLRNIGNGHHAACYRL
ncbi:MAG: ABC transporter ATP-binding protein [Treponema sp.]|jgi:oligopeptide/dipeptide ABC transporter ATP-binding protein|nr:ABC transporter ATP-binding protein [Treponema sp.]